MTLAVDLKRLPLGVEAGAVFGLTTKSQISPSLGAREAVYAKQRVLVTASIAVGPDDAVAVRNIFRRQIGPRWAFTVRDWSDYQVVDEPLIKVGSNYPLVKEYGDIERGALRYIQVPDTTSVVIKRNGVAATSGTFTITDGVVVPTSSWGSDAVTWSGNFFTPMRFTNDTMSIIVPAPGVLLIQTFDLLEKVL